MVDKTDKQTDRILAMIYCFVALAILGDVANVILHTSIGSFTLAKAILYGTELIIMIMGVWLAIKPSSVRVPPFFYVYALYILAVTVISLCYYDTYTVLSNSRKFLAPLPPLILGLHLGYLSGDERDRFYNRLILFLTIMSFVGLCEWIWWALSPSTLMGLYRECLDVGSFYAHIRQTSVITNSGMLRSGMSASDILIPGVTKRLTGLYFEPFAAGFNACLAVVLILYRQIATGKRLKWDLVFLFMNTLAVVLTLSRSSYVLLAIFILCYAVITRRPHFLILALGLPLLYTPFREFCAVSIESLGGGAHRIAVLGLYDFICSYTGSIDFIWGGGLGSMESDNPFYYESGYGSIFGQLGIVGVFMLFILYLSITLPLNYFKEDRFFSYAFLASVFVLLFFSGYPFGYKTFGLLHLFLGSTIKQHRVAQRIALANWNPQFNSKLHGFAFKSPI